MKNITLLLLTLLTLAGCSDKRESDISPNFNPGQTIPAGSLAALPSNQQTPENTPYTSVVPSNTNNQLPAPVYSVVNQPVHGTVNLNSSTGAYTYTPDVNYSGPDLFTWQVTQGSQTATASVNINVIPANLPPVANPINVTVVEDTPLTGTLTGTDPNGDPLTCSVVSLPLHGTLVINPNCTYVYTPSPNYFGPDSFTFQVSDGPLTSPPATVSINVTPVNDAPVASNSSFSTPEDTVHNGTLTGSDVEGSTLTYTVGTPPLHGNLVVNPTTGAYTYTPALNYNGPDSFTFTVNDGSLTSTPATVSINVTPVNDPPIAIGSSFTTPEDTTYSGTLSGVDPEGNNLTYVLTSSPTKGLVTIQNINLGTFTYQPYLNQNGTDSFTFKVNDGSLDSASVTVFVNITPVNDAPVALNSSFSVIAGGTHNGVVSATDVDSVVLTYILVSGPAQGNLTLNANGSYTYVANNSATGTDSFTFKANDSLLDSNVATVTISIGAAPNQPPVAQNTSLVVPEDTIGTGQLVANDPESSPLTYTFVTPPAHGSLVLNPNGSFTYTPNPNYNGPDSFTFKANDGVNDSNVGTLTIDVTPVNDLPIANNANYTINENQSLSLNLMASDVDGDALTYAIVTAPLHGTLTGTGANQVYTPALNYNGPDSFTFKVNDGTGDSNVATISITISQVNQAPVANNQNLTTPEDTPLAVNLLANDPDGDTLTYTVVSAPLHGTLTGTGSNLTYTPAPNYFGPDSFTYKANDGSVDSNIATISLNVTPVNDAPVAAAQSLTTPEETPINITLNGSDIDGNTLIYTVVTPPLHGTLSGSGANVVYTPALNYNGTDSFTFKVNDGTTDSNTATVSITVTPINDAPVANNQSVSTPEDTGLTINLTANDVDGDALTYSIVTQPTHGIAILVGSDVSYIPNSNYNGPDSFTFKVNDGTVNSNIATVSITVTPVNDAPVANTQNFSTPEDTAYNGTLTGSDPEGSSLTYIQVSAPSNGVLVLNPNGSFTYTPNSDYTGPDSFAFKVNDGTSDSPAATVSINVTPVNDAPVAYNQALNINEDTPVNITLTGSDVEGSPLTYTIISAPLHGTLSGTAPNIVYTPNANYNGTDTFTFRVNDGSLNSNLASIFITIAPVNDIPVAIAQNVSVLEDTPVNITLSGTDADGDALTYIIVNPPLHGTLSGSGANVVYTPAPNYNGPDSFSFKVNDGTADSVPANISLNVTPVNDAPVANNQSVTTPEDTAKNITLTGSDVEGSSLTYTILTAPLHGTLSGSGANVIYTPALNYNGPDSFSFKVNDGIADSSPATVSINVTPVNDAPIAQAQSLTTPEETPLNITLVGTDVDGDSLTYTIVTPPTHGTLSGTGSNIVYTPNTNYNGPDSFNFKVNDGNVDSNVATISLNVSSVNDAPVAFNQSVTTPEDTVVNIPLVASDADGNSLTYIITQQPLHGTLVLVGSDVNYIPAANYFGPDSFQFKVNDGLVDSNIATVSITVTPVNDAPVASNSLISVGQGQTVNSNMVASDVEGSPLTYTVIASPTKGTLTFNAATGDYSYTANVLSNGTDTFTFKANDGNLDSNVATVTININTVNFAPIANNQSLTTPEDTNVSSTLTYTDVNLDTVTFAIVASPLHGTVNLNTATGSFTYIPSLNYNGTDTFTFKVNDGSLDSNVAAVTINVTPVNDAPVANNQSVTTPEDTAKNITLTGSDVEGSPLTYTIVTAPLHGTLSGAGANVTYTPAANYFGPDSFTFKTNDGTVDSIPGTVSINVTPVNDAPIANNQSVTTPEDTATNITLSATDVDGDTLTYSIVTAPLHGTISGSGANIVYTPNSNYSGSDSFTFKANDGTLNSNIATVTITVTPVNDAPVASNQNVNTLEDTPVNITLSGTDPDGDSLTYIIVTAPLHGTLSGTGANVTYTPAANYFGPDNFSYKVNDGTVDSNIATVSVNVSSVNDIPVANNQSVTTPEDTAVNVNLTATDADGDVLTYSIITAPLHGTLTGTGSSLVYTPDANYFGSDSFTFRVNDGTVNSNIATVSLNVTPVNDAPLAQGQNLTTPEDTALNITLTGTDGDGDSLTYIIVSAPLHGTLSGVGPNKVYTPNANFNGSDSFTFKVNDGTIDSAIVTVAISVTPVNDAPVANNQSISTPEDTPVNITLTANDVDGDTLTYTVVSGPLHGTLSGTGANLVYTPNANYFGSDSLTFKANDGTIDSNVATISLNVLSSNDAPIANNQSVTTPEDTAKNIVLTATDIDGDTLTYSIVTPPLHGTISGSGTNITYTPALNYFGPDSFTFKANDGTVDSNVATISINVTPVNDAPIALNQTITAQEDTPLNITLTATDIDGDTLTYSIVTPPLHGTLSGTGANVVYTPNANYNGPDSFTFKANDGTIDSNVATIALNVNASNDAPLANNQSVTTPEDTALNITLTGTDIDGDSLTYIIVSGPLHGTLSGTGANRVYTPNANYNGPDSFTFKVNDGSLDSNIATISLNVTPVNDAPVANGQSLTVVEDSSLNITLTGSDADGDALTYTIISGPTNGTLTGTGINRVYTPNANYNGPDSFTFKVNDGTLDSAVATIAISVTPVNDAPIANNQNVNTPEDTAANITLVATDVDGDSLTYTIVSAPLHGTLTGSGANRVYTPNANYNGPDSFTFKVNDGTVDSNTATVSINVNSVNDIPVAAAQSVTTPEDTAKNITLSATDADGDSLTYIIVSAPLHGTLSGSGSNITYTPAANYNGPDSFTFKVNDGTIDSNVATVAISVTPVNDAPIAQAQSITTPEDTVYTGTLVATDVDGNSLVYSVVAQGTKGTVTITNTATGAFTYTPNANANGSDSFTFKVNDGTVDSNIATVSVNITPTNDAPVANNSSLTTPEDTAFNGTLSASDVDGDPLVYSVVAQGTKGTVTITNTATGAFTYTPNANANGSDSFTFKVNDGTLNSNTATVSVTITPVNDAPIAANQTISTPEDTVKTGTLVATDADGDALVYSIVAQGTKGTVTITNTATGAFTYTPNANANGTDTFTFKANDGTVNSNIATVTVNISPVNDTPIAQAQSVTTPEDTNKLINLVGTDVDGDLLSYIIVTQPTNGTLVQVGADVTYIPNLNYNGSDSFTFKVNDGTVDSNIATVSITVTPVNDAPVANNSSFTTLEDTVYNGTVTATDVDGNSLTYALVTNPTKGTVTLNTNGTYTYTPNLNANGSDSFTFRANDGTLNSNIATVSISITPVNDAPIANNQSVTTPEDTATNITLVGTDVDGDVLTYTIISGPTNGTLTGTGANRIYTPNANYNGTDSFTFRVNDGTVNSNTATVSITVTPVNDAPVAVNQSISTNKNTVATGTVVATDIDSPTLTYSVVANPAHGTVSINPTSGAFTYTPTLNYFGPDSFTFKANDGTLNSNIATVSITVVNTNVAPVANNQSISVTTNSTNNAITLSATDADSDPLTYTIVASPTNGTLSGTGANRLYTPNSGFSGTDTFTFKVNDGTVDSNTATVTITVNEWCDTNFAYSHKLVLNNQDQSSVLNNFPVMVKLNSSRVNYADIKANGDDIRFYDSACNSIPYEIERWSTSGDSTLWVKVPSIAANSNSSFIWMSYGNASAPAGQNKTAVWDSNYVGVYHFEETSGNALDSTSNTNTMVPNGTPVRNVSGRVAGAELFDSTTDRFAATSTPSLAMTTSSNFTLEAWVYVVSNTSNANVIERQYSATDGSIDYGLYVISGTPYMRARSKSLQFNTQLPLTTWTHLAATFDRNSNTCTLYVNGVQKAQVTTCTDDLLATGTQPTYIGGDQSNRYFNGGVDEPRISNSVRSADWIRAQHLTMTDGMVSYGTRRTLGQNPKQVLMTVKVNNDDGYIKTSSSQLFQSGSNGFNYMGSDVAAPKWAYYRFQLPATIPAGAVIKTAKLRLYGRDSSGSQYLTVHVQNAANPAQITAANQYPGGLGGVTVLGTNVTWGSPALSWLIDDWNQSPELKPVLDSLKAAQGGVLTSGNYIQVWVTKGAPLLTTDIGGEDNSFETINHAQLTIEYE